MSLFLFGSQGMPKRPVPGPDLSSKGIETVSSVLAKILRGILLDPKHHQIALEQNSHRINICQRHKDMNKPWRWVLCGCLFIRKKAEVKAIPRVKWAWAGADLCGWGPAG